MPIASPPTVAVRVWDLPTRIFHWALAACVLGLIVTGKLGGTAMPWHGRLGWLVGSLLLFRLAWGVAGGYWSRFSTFAYSPATVLRYLRGREQPEHGIGHNPLGSLSVWALLLVLLLQVGSGLFSDDREEFAGPLNAKVSNATARAATRYHKSIGQAAVLALTALHLAAIAYYRLRRQQRLVAPMWHGDKPLPPGTPAARDDARTRATALLVFLACAGLMGWIWSLGVP